METIIVVYPAPGLSHLISAVELAKLILSHSHSHSVSSITFLLTSATSLTSTTLASYITSVSSSFPSITFHSLPPPLPLSKHPSEYSSGEEMVFETFRNNTTNVRDALHSISLTHSISAFFLDFFAYTALEISRSLNIPTYFFFTSNASSIAFFLNLPVIDTLSTLPFRGRPMSFDIPGLFTITNDQMIDPMLDREVCYREFLSVGEAFAKADGIVVNSFEMLEPRASMGLKQGTCLPGRHVPPVYSLGPLILSSDAYSFSLNDQPVARHEYLTWLDSQPDRSVVYLAFGNYGRFSKEQLTEIAVGLEKSGVRFIWVVRSPPSEDKADRFKTSDEVDLDSILPEGFIDRTKDRGFLVKSWAPQIAILNHESVGGFVTHGGWNSVLEAVCAGVPMVAWPLYAEQRFNKTVLVEELKVALPMDESNNDRFVSSFEVEKRVKQLIMRLEDGDDVRKRVLRMKEEAKAALSDCGPGRIALAKLVESWKR